MPEVQAEMPKDLRLKWGVFLLSMTRAQTFELYAIKSTERVTDALRWKVT